MKLYIKDLVKYDNLSSCYMLSINIINSKNSYQLKKILTL